jgi:phospholipid/cholesterol/gamma-HCH transport system substrate-binding protein
METRAHHVLIGAFALGILVLAFLFVLWIGKLRVAREWDTYDIVFGEAVTGLTQGGAVQYQGIQVGEVRKLSLAADDPSKVIARVRVAGGTPVKTDTRAKLAFTGLTGVAIIQLTGGTREAPMLAAKNGEEVPRIIADTSALQKLLASSEDIVTIVNDLLLRLSKALNQENLDKVASTIDHLEKVTGRIAAHDPEIDKALADLASASASLKVTMAKSEQLVVKLDSLAANGNKILTGEAKEALATAKLSLESIRRFTDSANAMVEQNRGAIASFSTQGLQQIGPALNDLRATVRTLRDLSDQLKDDPASLVRGRKEQPKERQAQ